MVKFNLEEYKTIDYEDLNKYLEDYTDYTGWMDLDKLKDTLPEVKEVANYIKSNSEALLVIGIGGSYMGSKAVNTALNPYFDNNFDIYYLGYQLSEEYYKDVINKIMDKDIMVNIISKSGNTLEVETFYEMILEFMKTKYNEDEIRKRIIVTTEENDGYLYKEAIDKEYKVLVHPKDIGGRYTLFTPVHTLAMLVNNIDVDKMFDGAMDSVDELDNQVSYAIFRKEMFDKGKFVEAYTVYEEKLGFIIEWIKQLYAESLGKSDKGILPYNVVNTRDLHSLEQFMQDGNHIIFETIIDVETDGKLSEIKDIVKKSVAKAHNHIPSINITLDKLDEYNLGFLMQFMMFSCAISGYIENVNPFNQDGVEKYKKEMKQLLG